MNDQTAPEMANRDTDVAPEKQKPVETHRDGRVSAAIWANPGERGPIYNTTFSYA